VDMKYFWPGGGFFDPKSNPTLRRSETRVVILYLHASQIL
jgi:hypothetical protein